MIDSDLRLAQAVIVERAQAIAEDAGASRRRLPPRGWYGDPTGEDPLRCWNGEAWADGGTDSPPQ